jgi:hypothetical protein
LSVVRQEDRICLVGVCPVEDAEQLAMHLLQQRPSHVDARECASLHGAVLQVLLAFKPEVRTPPADPALDRMISRCIGAD